MVDPGRRGARTPSGVPCAVRTALASGASSVNHMEQIALDMPALLSWAFPRLAGDRERLAPGGLVAKMREGGRLLHAALGPDAVDLAAAFESDTVRGWGAMAIGAAPGLPIAHRLDKLRVFADDRHFAVREWAWLSLRPHVIGELQAALAQLPEWSADSSHNVRRFASEVTRPRGVWSGHIPELKAAPHLGMPVIEPLFADPSRYVQDSVGNWLNDASRTQPAWVLGVCDGMATESQATERIRLRALRTIGRRLSP